MYRTHKIPVCYSLLITLLLLISCNSQTRDDKVYDLVKKSFEPTDTIVIEGDINWDVDDAYDVVCTDYYHFSVKEITNLLIEKRDSIIKLKDDSNYIVNLLSDSILYNTYVYNMFYIFKSQDEEMCVHPKSNAVGYAFGYYVNPHKDGQFSPTCRECWAITKRDGSCLSVDNGIIIDDDTSIILSGNNVDSYITLYRMLQDICSIVNKHEKIEIDKLSE